MKVYIAGSSHKAECARVKAWHERLTRVGITVVSTWIDVIDQVGAANPRKASKADRIKWSLDDLHQLRSADVVWFLVPPPYAATRGAWFEFGVTYQLRADRPTHPRTIVSGDPKQSIFCALADEYDSDIDAFVEILRSYYGKREAPSDGMLPLIPRFWPQSWKAGVDLIQADPAEQTQRDAEERLAHISLELQARGFTDGLRWFRSRRGGSRIDASRENPSIDVLVALSPYPAEPYTFGVRQYDPTGVVAPIQHIPNHTVTETRLFEELDALLKRLGIEPQAQP